MPTFYKSPSKILYDNGNISLLIRPLRKEDSSILCAAVQESIGNLAPFMDWAHGELNEKNQSNRILASNQNYLQGLEYDFAVFDQSGEFLVSASWHPSKTRNKKCFEIGCWTHAKHCNKGLATLVVKILTVAAFEFMECDRVEIGCNKANIASKKVIEKCSFIFEGEIRNYFSKPTEAMLKNNYSFERSFLLFGLTSSDLPKIFWYQEIKKCLQILN